MRMSNPATMALDDVALTFFLPPENSGCDEISILVEANVTNQVSLHKSHSSAIVFWKSEGTTPCRNMLSVQSIDQITTGMQ